MQGNYSQMHKQKQMKLKSGLGAVYTIWWPVNGSGQSTDPGAGMKRALVC